MMTRIIFFILYFLIISPAIANESYENHLINKAEILNLSQNEEWLNMVYYEKNKFSSDYESIFDSQNFFLSKNGRKNPKLELEATLSSFFSDEYLPFNNSYNNQQTSQCAFKGRYEWLKEKLEFDGKQLKEQQCTDFNKWYKDLNPKSATLIFASSYLNNPASMFGHTFLLINGDNRQETRNILSYAINYSANTTETNGIAFAYKGLFGYYKGQFSTLQYHQMVKKYNNLENRDIWQYDLDLNDKDLRKIIINLWEISNNHANYYFFTENCSYILLKLLKITNNDIPLRKKLIKWVIPSDTVIDINKANGLILNSKYRPARTSLIEHLMQNSNNAMIKIARKIALEETLNKTEKDLFSNTTLNDQKITYDLAYEYLQYLYQKSKKIDRDKMAKLSFKILEDRSQLSGKTSLSKLEEPNTNPLLAHDPSRISLKYGHNNIKGNFTKFSLRPAYHDLMDSDSGFLKGAQINLLNFDFNYYFKNDHLKLDQFDLIDIKSYSKRNLLFRPLSWQLKVGAKNLYISDQDLGLVTNTKLGFGLNFDLDKLNSNITLLLSGLNYYGKDIDNDNLSALSPEINIITNVNKSFKIGFNFNHNFFKQESSFNYSEYKISHNYIISKNLNLDGYVSKKHYRHFKDDDEFTIGLKYYY